jgi:NADP-dependent aldehyde dehydrogenase
VRHPLVQAVAFTGSLKAGRALMDLAAARPHPIPCFAEMASCNPVFILPGALAGDAEALAQSLFNSFTLGAGQMCTKPGIILLSGQQQSQAFTARLSELVEQAQTFTLLTAGIAHEYARLTSHRSTIAGRTRQGAVPDSAPACPASAQFFTTSLDEFLREPDLSQEIFGPNTLLVHCDSSEDYLQAARALDGHLTATLLGTEQDLAAHRELIAVLEQKVGRLIFNGVPTGVEVAPAMVHGGPYPSTSDARFTAVGSAAIFRFARPVCFQNFPEALLPEELRRENPLRIERMIDGVPSREPLTS